jgi:Na+/H+ antiporter NhaA
MNYYHFNIPSEFVWMSHILMAFFFVYIGYEIIKRRKIPDYMAIIIIILGATGGFYHTHLWYDHLS